jgi:hypothetical protein
VVTARMFCLIASQCLAPWLFNNLARATLAL